MARQMVLGAGGIGQSTADTLARAGHEVTLVSRSGRPSTNPAVRSAACDVTDVDALARLAQGADTLINALNPASYTAWDRDWPPMADAILAAAQACETSLVTVSNLYLYGRVDAPMTEQTPIAPNGTKGRVRAEMWSAALAAHDAGRVRATEVRASDFLGPATVASGVLATQVLPGLVAGKRPVLPFGRADVPHSWTVDLDVAHLITAIINRDNDADWGQPWHVPTAAPVTVTDVCRLAAPAAGVPERPVRVLPRAVITVGGVVVPLFRALWETRHHLERPFIIDATAAQERFGLTPMATAEAVQRTVAALQERAMLSERLPA